MMKTSLFTLVFLAGALCACTTPAPANTIAALTAQAHAWDHAIIRKDMAAVAANMAPDFRHIRDNGTVSNGAAFLAFIGSPKLVIDPYEAEVDIRLYGEVALVTGATRMTGRYDGAPFKSYYRYTDLYARQGGAWRVVSVQITPIAD